MPGQMSQDLFEKLFREDFRAYDLTPDEQAQLMGELSDVKELIDKAKALHMEAREKLARIASIMGLGTEL